MFTNERLIRARMSRIPAFVLIVALGGLLFAASTSAPKFEPLPAPVSNNAVTARKKSRQDADFLLHGDRARQDLGRDQQRRLSDGSRRAEPKMD